MARKTVLVSDMSGMEIPADEGATVTIKFSDARMGTNVADVPASLCLCDRQLVSATADLGARRLLPG